MLKKYGGVNNKKSIGEIEEALVYNKPPVHLTKTQILAGLSLRTVKLIPTVLLIGAVLWVISISYLSLFN